MPFSTIDLCLETSERRREHTGPGQPVSVYAERLHLAVGDDEGGGRDGGPERPQLARVLRHLHPNPQSME